jgi:hypothetical protein
MWITMVIHKVIAAITSITFQYETNSDMNAAVDQKIDHEEYSTLKRPRKSVKIPKPNTSLQLEHGVYFVSNTSTAKIISAAVDDI